jgi:hypothetical protein
MPASINAHQVSSVVRRSRSDAIFVGRALADPERTLARPVMSILLSFLQEWKREDLMARGSNPKHRHWKVRRYIKYKSREEQAIQQLLDRLEYLPKLIYGVRLFVKPQVHDQ